MILTGPSTDGVLGHVVGIKITEIVHVAETEVAGNGTVLTALTEITDEIGLGTQVESHVIIGDLVLGLEAM